MAVFQLGEDGRKRSVNTIVKRSSKVKTEKYVRLTSK